MINVINLTPTSAPLDIPCPNGQVIQARAWGELGDCNAVALLIHGLGAHGGWFEAFANELVSRRIYAVSYDHIGFGNQRNVKFRSYKQWLDDLVKVFEGVKTLAAANGGKPIYLVGNSMGGLLSLVSVEFIQPTGLVLLSPGFDGYPETFTTGYRIGTVIRALLRPEMEVALPYGADLVTRDEPTRAWITNDPEGRFKVPGKHLLELLKLSNAVKSSTRQIKMPVLMLTAGKDRIVNNVVNQAFFSRLSAPSKQTKQFSEAWHDLMFDPVVDEVADEVVNWMAAQSVQQVVSN